MKSLIDRLQQDRPEMTLEERVERGREADRMLQDHSVFREIMDEVELQTLIEWRSSRDLEVRERAWAVMNAVKEVYRVMHHIADDGAVAGQVQEPGE